LSKISDFGIITIGAAFFLASTLVGSASEVYLKGYSTASCEKFMQLFHMEEQATKGRGLENLSSQLDTFLSGLNLARILPEQTYHLAIDLNGEPYGSSALRAHWLIDQCNRNQEKAFGFVAYELFQEIWKSQMQQRLETKP
jgi:hypothetical protein